MMESSNTCTTDLEEPASSTCNGCNDPLINEHEPTGETVLEDVSELTLDKVVGDLPFGKFHIKMLILTCGAYFAICCQMLLIVFLSVPLKTEWDLSEFTFPFLPFSSGLMGMIGSFTFGKLSDKYGRQKSFLGAMIFVSVFSLASAFAPTFWAMTLMRSLVTFGTSGIEAVNFVLLLEFLPRKNRGCIMVILTFCGALGAVFTAGMAWLLLPMYGWRWFTGAVSIPSIMVLVYRFLLWYESPRYLFISGQNHQGMKVLNEMAKQNKTSLPQRNIVCPPSEERGRLQDLFSAKLRGRTVVASFVWFLQSLGFWSVTMYLPEYMASQNINPYFSTFAVFVGELPGFCLAMILIEPHMFGRIKCLRFFSFITAASLIGFAVIKLQFIRVMLAMTVYCFMAPLYSILNTFTPEIYPTDTRNIAMAWVYTIIALPSVVVAFIGESVLWLNLPWLYPTVAAGFFALQFLFSFGLRMETSRRGLADHREEIITTSALSLNPQGSDQ